MVKLLVGVGLVSCAMGVGLIPHPGYGWWYLLTGVAMFVAGLLLRAHRDRAEKSAVPGGGDAGQWQARLDREGPGSYQGGGFDGGL